ncbi:hypothetical protein [Paenibacillus sp. RUD330]|uniref:YhgE/Pip domain-containing protein n=1 Tax=Paenibacillus sp. RUD330 TaxID=2023772 RepID=UPI0013B4860B|nr:hypothetical protein [Paenibacillus sp. RUD330]QID16116.1 hypothetical protein CIC07_25680 [Paenibacillus sp. RUD330]
MKAAQKAAAEAGDALKRAHAQLPAVTGLLRDAAKGIAFGQSKLDAFQSELPEAEKRIRDLAAKLRELRKKGNIGEAIDLLKSNYVQKAEFLARPIELKQHSLFPIANYGTAMTPFFTVLSLWVGALLLVSMLSLDVHREAAVPHAYLGRFLTFWAIGLLQSMLVTLGDIRETVGGLLPAAARRDLSMLLLFGVIALLAGLLLKKPLGRAAESLAAKARESGIIH